MIRGSSTFGTSETGTARSASPPRGWRPWLRPPLPACEDANWTGPRNASAKVDLGPRIPHARYAPLWYARQRRQRARGHSFPGTPVCPYRPLSALPDASGVGGVGPGPSYIVGQGQPAAFRLGGLEVCQTVPALAPKAESVAFLIFLSFWRLCMLNRLRSLVVYTIV